MEIIRIAILVIGWPALLIGSMYLFRQMKQFKKATGNNIFGKLIIITIVGWIITMYSLGIVATGFMIAEIYWGLLVVLPVFLVWVITMFIVLRITAQWTAETSLITQLNKLDQIILLSEIINQAPIGIYTINQQGTIDSFNPKMTEMAGAKSPNYVIGLNALQMATYKEVGLDTYFKEGLAGKPFETEVLYKSQTGQKATWRHYRGVPLVSPDGKTIDKLLLMVSDITKNKDLEAKLADNARQLEREVQERTRKLESLT
jgi:PAS domain S-box-containing protein